MRRLFLFLLRLVFGVSAAATLLVALFSIVPVPVTAFMLEASIARRGLVEYDWAAGASISPQLKLAVVAAEDQRFADHSGFDFEAIEKAAKHNTRGGTVRGATTMSQQVAKNLFLWPGRSWLRKGLEAALTVMI